MKNGNLEGTARLWTHWEAGRPWEVLGSPGRPWEALGGRKPENTENRENAPREGPGSRRAS